MGTIDGERERESGKVRGEPGTVGKGQRGGGEPKIAQNGRLREAMRELNEEQGLDVVRKMYPPHNATKDRMEYNPLQKYHFSRYINFYL